MVYESKTTSVCQRKGTLQNAAKPDSSLQAKRHLHCTYHLTIPYYKRKDILSR